MTAIVARPPTSARSAAHEALVAALRGRGYVARLINEHRARSALSDIDAGLALQIGLGAVRHARTIAHVLARIGRYDERRVSVPLRAALLAGAYQVIWLDRVPGFAAVDETVRIARAKLGPRGAGMVNALLRALTRALADRRTEWNATAANHIRVDWNHACAFTTAVLPDPASDALAYLAAATGERRARVHTLCSRLGHEAAQRVLWAAQAVPPLVLQRNPLRQSTDEFAERVAAAWPEAQIVDDAAYLPAGANLPGRDLLASGGAHVQDPTAQQAAGWVGAAPGERILDLCAAPGGKTITLAQRMGDQGMLLACDVDSTRLSRLIENVARLGLTCVTPRLIPPGDPGLGSDFDAALVDVPCSNSGVVARRPEVRLGDLDRRIAALAATQARLLRSAAAAVRAGGRLVYSTCSIEPTENEQIVAGFLAEQPDWALERQETTLPNWGPRLADWRDGGFAARLARRG